jgi:hypothetical protein
VRNADDHDHDRRQREAFVQGKDRLRAGGRGFQPVLDDLRLLRQHLLHRRVRPGAGVHGHPVLRHAHPGHRLRPHRGHDRGPHHHPLGQVPALHPVDVRALWRVRHPGLHHAALRPPWQAGLGVRHLRTHRPGLQRHQPALLRAHGRHLAFQRRAHQGVVVPLRRRLLGRPGGQPVHHVPGLRLWRQEPATGLCHDRGPVRLARHGDVDHLLSPPPRSA